MPDLTQALLIGIIIVLTILLVVLGVQAFIVLWEFRKTLNRTNKILEDVKSGTNIAKILGTIAALFLGKNLGKNFVDLTGRNPKKPEKQEALARPKRRFFRRISL